VYPVGAMEDDIDYAALLAATEAVERGESLGRE
jgi:hypothetical protein